MLDPVLLSRIQFTITIMFHYLFPPLTIGLALVMVFLEGKFLITKNEEYERLAKFWTKIFAVNFAMGVASGIVMEFQFGTNWATYSRFVGDVFGSALAAEGIFAFFLESGFLSILVFGWDRVSPAMHFFSTIMVFLGSVFSSVWIVIANSWQQTPAGFHVVTGPNGARAEITDFWAMVFNPSSVPRLVHVWIGAFILGAFFVLSISAYYLIKKRHVSESKKCFTLALWVATITSLAAPFAGHVQAKIVAKYQPAKLAAMEAHFKTGKGGSEFVLWGHPDVKTKTVKGKVAIPKLLSFFVHEDLKTPVTGLDKFKPKDTPPVALTYYLYRIMILLGLLFIGVTLLAQYYNWRGVLFEKVWLLKIFVVSVVGPYIANMAGWSAAEVGRQPWTVYNLLRTSDSVSKAVKGEQVLSSIILFGIIYILLFWVWIYILNKKIQHGPEPAGEHQSGGALAGAAAMINPMSGSSLTMAHEDNQEEEK